MLLPEPLHNYKKGGRLHYKKCISLTSKKIKISQIFFLNFLRIPKNYFFVGTLTRCVAFRRLVRALNLASSPGLEWSTSTSWERYASTISKEYLPSLASGSRRACTRLYRQAYFHPEGRVPQLPAGEQGRTEKRAPLTAVPLWAGAPQPIKTNNGIVMKRGRLDFLWSILVQRRE